MGCMCGLEKDFELCCGAIINTLKEASTPQELMKSRYSAYCIDDGDYLAKSAVNHHSKEDIQEIENFSDSVEWLKLDILSAQDDIVEFKAYYRDNDGIKVLHEKSRFVQKDTLWRYKDGELYNTKIERNEPCPCGSGKKFKKCCFSKTKTFSKP